MQAREQHVCLRLSHTAHEPLAQQPRPSRLCLLPLAPLLLLLPLALCLGAVGVAGGAAEGPPYG